MQSEEDTTESAEIAYGAIGPAHHEEGRERYVLGTYVMPSGRVITVLEESYVGHPPQLVIMTQSPHYTRTTLIPLRAIATLEEALREFRRRDGRRRVRKQGAERRDGLRAPGVPRGRVAP